MKKLLLGLILAAFAGCSSFEYAKNFEYAKKSDDSFVIASYNIRCPYDKGDNNWQLRIPRLVEVIEKYEMDIFGVQEAVKYVADTLQAELDGFRRIGCGRELATDGESNFIFYNEKRFECLDYGTFWLSNTPLVSGSRYKGAGCPRTCTWGRFKDLKTGKVFTYYNTHLDHVSNIARENGIKLIVKHARAKANSLPLILTGDFNAVQGSETYKTAAGLLNDSALISETPRTGAAGTFTGYGKSKKQRTIDFIFVSDDFRVLTHKTDDTLINGQYASDHNPVVAELQMK